MNDYSKKYDCEKRKIMIIIMLFSTNLFAQPQWHFEAKIETYNGILFEGAIADRYPITMYLEFDGFCSYENRRNYSYRLKGWYYYNNRKIKLPLIGTEKIDLENGNTITLYVPQNILDDITENTCNLDDFGEIFISQDTENGFASFESMNWKTTNSSTFMPVKLKRIPPQSSREAYILLYVREIEMYAFNLIDKLCELTDCKSNHLDIIESIEILASKADNNDFYLIFSFSHRSIPTFDGRGYCGAGYEVYLGFLHISSLEVKKFEYFKTDSCFFEIEEEYTYDENAIEKGIIEVK